MYVYVILRRFLWSEKITSIRFSRVRYPQVGWNPTEGWHVGQYNKVYKASICPRSKVILCTARRKT